MQHDIVQFRQNVEVFCAWSSSSLSKPCSSMELETKVRKANVRRHVFIHNKEKLLTNVMSHCNWPGFARWAAPYSGQKKLETCGPTEVQFNQQGVKKAAVEVRIRVLRWREPGKLIGEDILNGGALNARCAELNPL